jgi:hypothetical protein
MIPEFFVLWRERTAEVSPVGLLDKDFRKFGTPIRPEFVPKNVCEGPECLSGRTSGFGNGEELPSFMSSYVEEGGSAARKEVCRELRSTG